MSCSKDKIAIQLHGYFQTSELNKPTYDAKVDKQQENHGSKVKEQSKLKEQLQQLQSRYVKQLNRVNCLRSTNQAIGKTVQQLKIKSYCHKKQSLMIDKQNMNSNRMNSENIFQLNKDNDKKQTGKPKKRVINLQIKSKNQTDNDDLQLCKQKCQSQLKQLNQALELELDDIKETNQLVQQRNNKKIFEMQKLIMQYKTLCEQILKRTKSYSKNKEANSISEQRNSQTIANKKCYRSVNQKKKLNFSGMMQSEVYNVQPSSYNYLKSAIQVNRQSGIRKSNSKVSPNSLSMLNQLPHNLKKPNKLSLQNYGQNNLQKSMLMFNNKRSEQIVIKDCLCEDHNSSTQFYESGSKVVNKLSKRYNPNEQVSLHVNLLRKHSNRYDVRQPSLLDNSIQMFANKSRCGKSNFMSINNLKNCLNNSLGQQTTIKKTDSAQQSLNSSLQGVKYFVKYNYGSDVNPKKNQTLNMISSSNETNKEPNKLKQATKIDHSVSSCSLLGFKNKSYQKIVTRITCQGCQVQFRPTEYFNHIEQCRQMEKIQLLKQRDRVSQKLQNAFQKSIL